MKAIKAKLQEQGKSPTEVDSFEKRAAASAKKIVAKFKDYEFYTGEGMNPDGMYVTLFCFNRFFPIERNSRNHRIALLNYREDGVTPYMTFWKDGLSEMKV
jgi:hypothetical protein